MTLKEVYGILGSGYSLYQSWTGYIDEMLKNSVNDEDHIGHLREMFRILYKYQMKLNPLKFTFGVVSEKFLGYMMNQCRIEANSEKIKTIKEEKRFEWTDECENAFRELRILLDKALLLSKPKTREMFLIYLAVSEKVPREVPTWKLYIDGSSGEARARAGILLISPNGHNLNCALHLEFKASNNAAKYETLPMGLRLTHEMKARKIKSTMARS
ncbi:Ribonuclease H [Abeliophyllum distichum]|uniref:Ribonuclease H n=1 Tax=Abeliophyllum distichum TaxID=126358 RepID=A0ABD1W0R5_9LAMI